MDEYIERDALLEVVEKSKFDNPHDNPRTRMAHKHEHEHFLNLIMRQPAADVVEVVPELRKAVELLRKEYEKAKNNPIVRDPLAYALFQVWKTVDGRKNGR